MSSLLYFFFFSWLPIKANKDKAVQKKDHQADPAYLKLFALVSRGKSPFSTQWLHTLSSYFALELLSCLQVQDSAHCFVFFQSFSNSSCCLLLLVCQVWETLPLLGRATVKGRITLCCSMS